MSELLNAGLLASRAGRPADAAAIYRQVVDLFDADPPENAAGFNHEYPLQAAAAIALVRWGEACRSLGDTATALNCFERCHNQFRAAMEEQAGEEDWWARQWSAEAQLRRGDLLVGLGRDDEARAAWSALLPVRGFMWPSLADWADEASDRLRGANGTNGTNSSESIGPR